ncbi:MAG: hypothetical protein IT249_07235 [Chitinophagaceae bacterium]|nr:hypothetical protein [Chitinophagaceae bacterium]
MNRKLPYEELIAEKMQKLNLPGRDDAWQKMQDMLNKEMPQEPAGKKRFAWRWRNRGWLALLLTGFIGTGVYFYNNDTTGGDTAANIKPDNTRTKKNIVSPKQIKTSAAKNNSTISPADENIPSATQQENSLTTTGSISTNNKPQTNNQPAYKPVEGKVLPEHLPQPKNDNIKSSTAVANEIEHTVGVNNQENKKALINNVKNEAGNKDDIAASLSQNNQTEIRSTSNEAASTTSKAFTDSDNENNSISALQAITALPAKPDNDELAAPASDITLTVPDNVWQLPDVAAKKKTILKEMKQQEKKQERELAKSYKSHWSFWGNETDRWFAAGIAPYQNFAIASQQSYNYNSGAGRNMIADYIPSPYLQLHVTDRIYLLSEFQFNSPQATPNLLLARNNSSIPMSNMGYTENIYLRKLYYFNMPLSFYYSPVKNFYLGSGLQFSSLNSGLAYSEQVSDNNTVLNARTFKIKDDSLSSKINGSEWRYLFDANYYMNRFMIGFRYNQALNNFVNLKVNNILPPTQARNQAFQFYIRYNLVVSKKH